MTRYKKGTIKSMADIIFEKEMIVSGNVNKTCWMWRVPGMFIMNDGAIVFEDIHGAAVPVDENINVSTKEC